MNDRNSRQNKFLHWVVLFVLIFSSTGSEGITFAYAKYTKINTSTGSPLQPAHYIVFERNIDGTLSPVFHKSVELAMPLLSLTGEQVADAVSTSSRNGEFVVINLYNRMGEVVYESVLQISPWIRGEFHGLTDGAPIDGHVLQAERTSFVVRVPRIEETTLIIKDEQFATIGQFDLASIASQELPFLDIPSVLEAESTAGPVSNRVDLLVMGDGYTTAESSQFKTDATNVANNFFSISPYSEYKNYFNIYKLFTASSDTGADHPPYNDSCGYGDPNCCGDPAMQNDPLKGQMVDTAFDAHFCAYWIHRLLVVDYSKVLAAAAAMPDWDTILLIVNDSTYGGSGGTISVVSTHSYGVQIAQHEFGHSFVDLADEYESSYPGYPSCSDINGPACESNVTDVTDPDQIKWSPWILPGTPLPTPENNNYANKVGLFRGARYLQSGMYRPGLECIMRSLGAPFCQVPSQSFVLKLYNGGWGIPGNGINLIEPGGILPSSEIIHITRSTTQAFHVNNLQPIGGPPARIVWVVNGKPISGENKNTFSFTTNDTLPERNTVTVRINDATSLVHPDMAGGSLQDKHTWTVYLDAQMYSQKSNSTQDGRILESAENSNVGGSMNSSDDTLRLGDDVAKKQYRSILSFATGAGLPDTAVITNVTLKIKKQAVVGGGNPVTMFQGFMADVQKGSFGTSALQVTDWKASAGKTVGPLTPSLAGGWYTLNLTSAKNFVNKLSSGSGLTQIRLRFKLDDNNNAVANYLSLYSGNAGAANRPQLIIEYYVP